MIPGQNSFSADVPIRVNEKGLRGPMAPYTKRENETRVLLLGDSIVFGYGVPENDILSSRMEEELNAKHVEARVVNSGVPSYNTEQEVAFLRSEGEKYAADWVILGFCWNDLSKKTGVTVDGNGMLVSEGATEPGRLQKLMESQGGYSLRNTLKMSRLLYAVSLGLGSLGRNEATDRATALRSEILEGRMTETVSDGWSRVENSLELLEKDSRMHRFKILVVAFPMLPSLESSYPQSSYPARLSTICAKLGLDLLDLEPVFRKHYRGRESLFLPYDPDHPNTPGHALAAAAIVEWIAAHSSAEGPLP
jgi:lysophospholipase L1-like esterase